MHHGIDSGVLNQYLAEIGGPGVSAKVFRTWGGTLSAFEQAVSLFPANPVLNYRIGVIHMGRGQFQDALVNLKKALRLRPVYPEAEKLCEKITGWVEKFEGLAKEKGIEE